MSTKFSLTFTVSATGKSIKYIVEVESLLKETWKFLENSPKRTKEVVPCLTTLSKTFQAGALNSSHVAPAINHTQASLEAVKSSQSSWPELPYPHQSPMHGQKGVQVRLKRD